MQWTSGYVADIDYTHGFYRELTPAILAFAASLANLADPPNLEKLRYCELGCGQGLSANIIAAANPGAEIHATDFNPSQIAGARFLSRQAGLVNVHFHEHAFADFAAEPSLPAVFDIIALHGIYSWISAENRRHIVEFIRRKLRPGGLVYISYNTLPGWASAMPLRRLLVDQAATRTGPIAPRIDEGIALAETLIKAKAGYFAQNPAAASRFDKIKSMSRSYLAHEYLNADWTPFYFADVVRELAEAKLSFLCSAHLPDAIDTINLTTDQTATLKGVGDPIRRQTLRDFMVNQQFRRDIFVKGGPLLSSAAAQAQLLDQRFVMSTARNDVSLKLSTTLGEMQLQSSVYHPVLDSLSAGPITIRQMLTNNAVRELGWARLREAMMLLVGSGHLQPCLSSRDELGRVQQTKVFNAAVLRRAEFSGDLAFLASPVTGGGIQVDRIEQLFLSAMTQDGVDPAERAWSQIAAQGQSVVKDGKPLSTPEENLAELQARLAIFMEKRLPVLKQLGVT